MKRRIAAAGMFWVATACAARAGVPAFPGAEGFGAAATGGRGGAVYHVTTLNDAGPGTLRDAVSEPNRTVVFDVGGVINVNAQISFTDNLTVAGQTAPGGIAIYGGGISLSGHKNIIVRYLTARSGIKSPKGSKSLNIGNASDIIVDHVSAGWGRWDNVGITKGKEADAETHDVTMQNCLIHEAIGPQRFGMLLDDSRRISVLRNLWINNRGRNPKDKGDVQFINNVIYNWGDQGYGGGHSAAPWNEDVIGNYLIAGPSSNKNFFGFVNANDRVYSEGNFVDLDRDGALDGRAWTADDVTKADPKTKEGATPSTRPYNVSPVPVTITSAEQAVADAIAGAGNSLHRDAVDLRQIDDLKSFGKRGQNPNDEAEVGGMPPSPPPAAAPADADHDGIADDWEAAHHVTAADANKVGPSGYTPLEEYVNSLAAGPQK